MSCKGPLISPVIGLWMPCSVGCPTCEETRPAPLAPQPDPELPGQATIYDYLED